MSNELKRVIGPWALAANMVNIIIGAGIFVLPALVAEQLGASSIFAYLFCGILISLVMLCFAEVGSKVTKSGGAYAYIEVAFGKYIGFITAILFICSCISADAAVANALVSILSEFIPFLKSNIGRILFFVILFGGFAIINYRGIKGAIRTVVLLTSTKLLALLALVIIGWTKVDVSNLMIEQMPTFKDIGTTSLMLFFAFQGAESGISIAGEVKNPNKNIPKAIFIAICAVLTFYILIQTVSLGVLGDELVQHKENPLAEVAHVVFGPIGLILMSLVAATSMTGNLSSQSLSVPRILFSASLDQVLPLKIISKIHPKFGSPSVAIVIYASIAFILASSGGFKILAIVASATMLFVYFGVALAAIKLRKKIPYQSKFFKNPGGLTVPVLTLIVIIWFLSHLKFEEWQYILIFTAFISLFYFIINRLKK